jgi:hypothetical protein
MFFALLPTSYAIFCEGFRGCVLIPRAETHLRDEMLKKTSEPHMEYSVCCVPFYHVTIFVFVGVKASFSKNSNLYDPVLINSIETLSIKVEEPIADKT